MIKKIAVVISALLVLFSLIILFTPSNATLSNESFINEPLKIDTSSIKTDNNASILMNLNTNQILFQENVDKASPVYSVSKVMFLATAANRIKNDNISYNTKIKVPSYIEDVQNQYSFSNSFIQKNQYYTIEELFKAVMIPSGNDAAILLGEYLFGSHLNAVNAMNEFALELEMKNSTFVSTSGLDGKYLRKAGIKASNGKNLMSINDLVILIKHVKVNAPIIIEVSSEKQAYIGRNNGKILLRNVNQLISIDEKSGLGIYGLKTGSNIEEYSNSLVSLKLDKNKQDILSITIGSNTRASMYKDVKNMYKFLSKLETVDLKNGINIDSSVGFSNNDPRFGLKDSFILYVPKNQMFNYKLINPINYNGSLNRFYGVNKNDTIGELDIQDANYFFQGKAIGLSDVIVLDEVVPMNIFEMIQQIIYDIFNKNNQ